MSRQIIGSREVALKTAELIHRIVSHVRFHTIDELIALIRAVGRHLVEANPEGTSGVYRLQRRLMR